MVRNEYPVIDVEATGENIRRLREKSGLTVKDLQNYFGFEMPQAIYKWQRGESLPSVDNLYALGRLLNVPMEQIIVQNKPLHIRQERTAGDRRSFFMHDPEKPVFARRNGDQSLSAGTLKYGSERPSSRSRCFRIRMVLMTSDSALWAPSGRSLKWKSA